ncbi:MAG: hypothetical protein NXI31_22340 [bacterium]|nr:hypothetical protein [bacterium]
MRSSRSLTPLLILAAFWLSACRSQPDPTDRVFAADPAPAVGTTCPECDASQVVPVLHGYLGPEGEAMVLAGRAVHGGCSIGGPNHVCRACGHEMVRRSAAELARVRARDEALLRLLEKRRALLAERDRDL